MDFPLQNAFMRGLLEPEGRETGLLRIYQSLADDFLYADPRRLVVFPDNHDMSRIYTQLGERLDLYQMAMVFFATVRGTPQFFYGSEILMANPLPEADGVLRRDFPGGWAGRCGGCLQGAGLTPDQTASAGLHAASPHLAQGRKRDPRRRAHAVRAAGRCVCLFPPG